MATWQQGINSGGFLAGIGTQNENAPKASDINATLGLIRENNELARSGANNVGLTALRGLAGVADIYNQEQQQKAISAFNKVHADAWASGDPSGLFKFAQENPAFVAQAQQAFSGLNDQQRNDMGDLAMRANVALSQGPEAYSKFITDNKDRLNRVHTTDLLQPTSRVGKMAQTTAENIPLAGTSGMRATQQEARSQLVQRFADKFGEYDPAVVIDSLKAKTSGIRRAAGNRLEQVQNAMAGVNIQPARAIQQIDTEISNLQKLGKVADNETISKLQSYRDELVRNAGPDGPVNLDLKQLSDLRSQFRMDVKGERPVLPNRSDAAIQRVYKAMTDDINGAIGQNLGNDTLRKYQQANSVYADEAAKLKNTRLKNVLMKGDLTPEVVNNMLFSKNKSEIKTLYNSVGRVGRAQMRNGIIGKAMEKSGGSPDQFLRQLNILKNQTGITFKGQDAAYLKGLKNYLQSTQQAAKAAVTTPTGQQTIPFIIGYGTAMNPATTGAAVSYGLLTRAYESEPFRNAMLRMANTPRGSTAFEKAMRQAQKAINALTQGAKSDALSE
ncbi:phage DNA ejection protein [Escherichia coli]|uniref:phage DNA ejection protein n=5 Tax=Enterobacteriaceae TaxID=543 RepID=UPI000DE021F4|nr:phage DNA ejection protein [Escherichia coli]